MENKEEIKSEDGTRITEQEFDIVPTGEKNNPKKHLFYILILLLVASASFGFGMLVKIKKSQTPVIIRNEPVVENSFNKIPTENLPVGGEVKGISAQSSSGIVIGSKNSNKYHYPWCSGAQRISDANKIYFSSVEEARKSGYIPAANCKGLK